MKAIIYQQADDFLKQPRVTLQFPDALPGDEMLSMECEKICEEIHSILHHAALKNVMSTRTLSKNAQAPQEESEESI